MTRRSSAGTTRAATAPEPVEQPGPVPPAPPEPPSRPPIGNALLVLFGVFESIFGALSVLEIRGGGPGYVFASTVVITLLMIVLGAWYKAGLLAPGPGTHPPKAIPAPPAEGKSASPSPRKSRSPA